MPTQKRQFGDIGEEKAANFLRQKGYKILARNWSKHNCGEIDIVAAKVAGLLGRIKEIVFVEVKTIEGGDSELTAALAAQNVHYKKQRRLIKTAQKYLLYKKMPKDIPWQIDVIIVVFNDFSGLVKIEHLENAVWGK